MESLSLNELKQINEWNKETDDDTNGNKFEQ